MEHQHRLSEKRRFSIVRRAQSFTHAGRGIVVFLQSTHNAWIELSAGALAVFLGFRLHIDRMEWGLLIIAIAIVIVTEAINTAIEIDIDLTSPEEHPYARDTKDVAAGAVLIASIGALAIGAIVFLPHLI